MFYLFTMLKCEWGQSTNNFKGAWYYSLINAYTSVGSGEQNYNDVEVTLS